MPRDKRNLSNTLLTGAAESFRAVKSIVDACQLTFRDLATADSLLLDLVGLAYLERGWNHGLGAWLYRLTPLGVSRRQELIEAKNATRHLMFA